MGIAVWVGSQARQGIQVGDRVGVGPICHTCLRPDCEYCSTEKENYCPRKIPTYGGIYPDGSISYGGFANFCRHNSQYVFSIPQGLASGDAAVMLCAGSTVYEPLKEHGAGPGKRVGIIGIGGLGHFGLLFAKALGSEHVVAISRGEDKRADALTLGADQYIASSNPDWTRSHISTLDLIICTVSSGGKDMPLLEYLSLLRPRGKFCQVGIPEDNLPRLPVLELVGKGIGFFFSDSGSPARIREMLNFAVEKGIRPWVESRPMENVNQVMEDMSDGKARFRYVLENLENFK